jgi:hypothetical protein
VGSTLVLWQPRVRSLVAFGDAGAVMFPRLVRAAAVIGGAGVGYQLWNAMLQVGALGVLPPLGALLLVLALAVTREKSAWVLGTFGALLLVGGQAPVVAAALVTVTCALTYASKRAGAPRFAVAGVLAAVATVGYPHVRAGGISLADPPLDLVGVVVLATAVLLVLLARKRAWSAAPALVVLYAPLGEVAARSLPGV